MEFVGGDNGGGCKQRAFDSLDFEESTFNYSEEEIDNIIMEIFEYSFCMISK